MTVTTSSFKSTFPRELEREIFELAARADPWCIPRLMRVAWRVRTWVRRLQLPTLILLRKKRTRRALDDKKGYPFEDDGLFRRVMSIPPSLLKDSLQNLCLHSVADAVAQRILSALIRVQNLWIVHNPNHPSLAPMISTLPLQRLHCTPDNLFPPPMPLEFRPSFTYLTHLELLQSPLPMTRLAIQNVGNQLLLLASVTYFAFSNDALSYVCSTLLRDWSYLRVVIYKATKTSAQVLHLDLDEDPRFVQMVCSEEIKDWQMGDVWRRFLVTRGGLHRQTHLP
ncbi:hypothetical protein FB45DRAFT_1036717 [Roridomyces roridus]|uniref:Uncharacterized protein n=1 Tax=Roridomyces roridus TaxID=1738132 RepID=A0AAD7B807_9AGAR|nr:hypothetical protein FB45DRAFT_1036717 [Roridomyces roridus]